MTREEVLKDIKEVFKSDIIDISDKSPKRIYIEIKPESLVRVATYIFKDQGARFNIASGSDVPDHLEILYHFTIEEINLNGRSYRAYFSARRMEEGCLRCHGDPKDAPSSLVARYGDTAGFRRPIGEIIALDMVAIPIDKYQTALVHNLCWNAIFLALVLLVLFVGVYGAVGLTYAYEPAGSLSSLEGIDEDILAREKEKQATVPLVALNPPGTPGRPQGVGAILEEDFETWPPAAWTIVNNGGDCVWESTTVVGRPNYAGGDGQAAIAEVLGVPSLGIPPLEMSWQERDAGWPDRPTDVSTEPSHEERPWFRFTIEFNPWRKRKG